MLFVRGSSTIFSRREQRAISKYNARGQVDRITYKATSYIAILSAARPKVRCCRALRGRLDRALRPQRGQEWIRILRQRFVSEPIACFVRRHFAPITGRLI